MSDEYKIMFYLLKGNHDVQTLQAMIRHFNNARDWGKHHTPKNLAASIAIEAGELLECYQWADEQPDKEKLANELADVFIYGFNLADKEGVDVATAIACKLDINAKKYPVEKCKGSAKKYDQL